MACQGGTGPVKRWLALSLGLAVAGGALYLLVGGGRSSAPSDPPLDHIDAGSRQQLDRVLRDAEQGP